MSENQSKNEKIKVYSKYQDIVFKKMSTCEILRMAFYEFWGLYPEDLAKDRGSSSHNTNQVNETSNV